MSLLFLKNLPRYECLSEAAREFPDLDPSATEAFLHILRAGDAAFELAASHLSKHVLSQGRFGVLMVLWGKDRRCGASGSLTPAELADLMGVTRATITGLVDGLVRDGLVSRAPHTDDRRMLSVELTQAGRDLLIKVMPEHFRRMAWLLEPLLEEERTTLVALLRKVQVRAAERTDSPVGTQNASA